MRMSRILPALALAAATTAGAAAAVAAGTAAGAAPTPAALAAQHQAILAGLDDYAREAAPTAAAARELARQIAPHMQREEETVFPLLALMPRVADGEAGPHMTWSVALADDLRGGREALFDEHARIMGAVGDLLVASERGDDPRLAALATRIAAHLTEETEVLEPAAILVGDTVRRRLAPDR